MSFPVKRDKKNGSTMVLERTDAEAARLIKAKLLEHGGSATYEQLLPALYPGRYRNERLAREKMHKCVYRWLWLNKIRTKADNGYKIVTWKGSKKVV